MELVDSYDEDEVELNFLRSVPACFIVLGKPFSGKSTLARKLADEWRCPLVSVDNVLADYLASDKESESDNEGPNSEELIRLLDAKMKSLPVSHAGYVLDGFPCSFSSGREFQKQLQFVRTLDTKPNFVICINMPDADVLRRKTNAKTDSRTGRLYVREQYAPWPTTGKEDKLGSEVDSYVDTQREERGEGVEEDASEFASAVKEDAEFVLVDDEVKANLVTTPEFYESNVNKELQHYGRLSAYVAHYLTQQSRRSIFELDGNIPPRTLFQGLVAMLRQRAVPKPILAFPLEASNVDDAADEAAENDASEEPDWDGVLESYPRFRAMAPMFPWRLSRWTQRCPVALLAGSIVNGKPEHAVAFADKLYFLSSKEARRSFLENPRPYLVPPMPKHPPKFLVVGHPYTDVGEICRRLREHFEAEEIDVAQIINDYVAKAMEIILEEVWLNAICEALEEILVRETLQQAVLMMSTRRSILEGYAREQAIEEVATMSLREEQPKRKSRKNVDVVSETPEEARFRLEKNKMDLSVVMDRVLSNWQDQLFGLAFQLTEASTVDDDAAAAVDLMKDVSNRFPKLLMLPKNQQRLIFCYVKALRSSELNDRADEDVVMQEAPVVDSEHQDVAAYVLDAEDARTREGIVVTLEQKIQLLKSAVEELQADDANADAKKDVSWIMSNFPIDVSVLAAVAKERLLRPAAIVVVRDGSPNYGVVRQRWLDAQFERLKEGSLEESNDAEFEEEMQSEAQSEEESLFESESTEEDASDEFIASLKVFDQAMAELPEAMPAGNVVDIIFVDVHRAPAHDSNEDVRAEAVVAAVVESLLASAIRIATGVDEHKRAEEIVDDIVSKLNAVFQFHVQETNFETRERDDEDLAATGDLIEIRDAEVAETDEEKKKEELRLRGDAGNFCPVMLKEKWILYPGDPGIGCKFRGRSYAFSSDDALRKFKEAPAEYVASKSPLTPPPLRVCFVGPRGSGKTAHSRSAAAHYDVFHVDFRERLQELIFPKACMRFGLPHQVDDEDIEADDAAIAAAFVSESVQSSLEFMGHPYFDPGLGSSENSLGTLPSSSSSEGQSAVLAVGVSESSELLDAAKEEESLGPERPPPSVFSKQEEEIKAFLQSNAPLSDEFSRQLLTTWWTEEPTRSAGFILDGFPQSEAEAQLLSESDFFPDVALFLSVDEARVLDFFLPRCMSKWKERTGRKLRKRQEEKLRAAQNRLENIAQRRAVLQAELRRRKLSARGRRMAETALEPPTVAEPIENAAQIESVLAEEFPEIVEEQEVDETKEEAAARYTENIVATFNANQEQSSAVKEVLERYQVPCYTVNGNAKRTNVASSVKKILDSIYRNKESVFERVHPVTTHLARRLVAGGYKMFSNYGPWCPVQLAEGAVLPPYYTDARPPFPAVHRHHVYFLSSERARVAFARNPIKYLKEVRPKLVVPLTVSVLGPPKSGKTTLAERFETELHVKRLCAGEAIRYVIDKLPHTCLATELFEVLNGGQDVPDNLMVASVEAAVKQIQCQLRGIVLDGFPLNMYHVQRMDQMNLIPFAMMSLEITEEECLKRWVRSGEKQVKEYMSSSFQTADSLLVQMQNYYVEQHRNWFVLDAARCQWWLWETAGAHFKEVTAALQDYVVKSSAPAPVAVNRLAILPASIQSRYGEFSHFCPVSVARDNELVESKRDSNFQHLVEYKGKFYNLSSKEYADMFIANPAAYLPPNAPRMPPSFHFLPTVLSEKMMRMMNIKALIQFGGYCPVTFVKGFQRYDALLQGFKEYGVLYKRRVYLMANEAAREVFLRNPERYALIKLPFKRPPTKELPVDVMNLPALGYLEQTVVKTLIKALTAVAGLKPKYPFRTITESALMFLHLYMKAHNASLPAVMRNMYKERLHQFEEECRGLRNVCEQILHKRCLSKSRAYEYNRKLDRLFVKGNRAKKRRNASGHNIHRHVT